MAGIERKGQQLGSIRVDASPAAEDEDLSKLLKADLVERAEQAGIETEGLTKADLVEALQASEGEG